MFELLPYVEEDNYYRQCVNSGVSGSAHTIKMFLSPVDPTVDSNNPENSMSSYGANAFALQKECRLGSSFSDGTSHTIVFAEHYAYGCGGAAFSWFATEPIVFDIPTTPTILVHRASFAEPAAFTTERQGHPDDHLSRRIPHIQRRSAGRIRLAAWAHFSGQAGRERLQSPHRTDPARRRDAGGNVRRQCPHARARHGPIRLLGNGHARRWGNHPGIEEQWSRSAV